jgi:CheY-like chemotaxis protein
VNWIKARRLKAHRTPGGHRRIAEEDLASFMLRHGMPVPPELTGAAPERRKALVIGASGPAREGAVRLLASSGYAAEQASPGFTAGAAAARFEPDVVVLQADGDDGGEVLRALRLDRDLSAVPVVGVGRSEWLEGLRTAGCAVAISGPVGDGGLADAVAEALRGAAPSRRGGDRVRTPRRRRRSPASR